MGAALVLLLVGLGAMAAGVLIGRYYVPDDRQLRRTARHSRSYMRALSHLVGRDPEAAIAELRDVVEENVEDAEPYFALGAMFRSRGEHERAIRVHQSLAVRERERRKLRQRAMFELGLDFRAAGMPRRATRAMEEVLLEEPDHEAALRVLAALYEEQGRFNEAAGLWGRLGKLRKEDVGGREHHLLVAAAQAAIARGDLDSARQLLKAAQKQRASAHLFAAAAELAAARGKHSAARARLKQALVAEPALAPHLLPGLVAAEEAELGEGGRGGRGGRGDADDEDDDDLAAEPPSAAGAAGALEGGARKLLAPSSAVAAAGREGGAAAGAASTGTVGATLAPPATGGEGGAAAGAASAGAGAGATQATGGEGGEATRAAAAGTAARATAAAGGEGGAAAGAAAAGGEGGAAAGAASAGAGSAASPRAGAAAPAVDAGGASTALVAPVASAPVAAASGGADAATAPAGGPGASGASGAPGVIAALAARLRRATTPPEGAPLVGERPALTVAERVLATLAEVEAETGPRLELALIRAQLAPPADAAGAARLAADLAARFPDALAARVATARLALAGGDPASIRTALEVLVADQGALAWTLRGRWQCAHCGNRPGPFSWRCGQCRRWGTLRMETGLAPPPAPSRERRAAPRTARPEGLLGAAPDHALPRPTLDPGLSEDELARGGARPSLLGRVGGWLSGALRRDRR